MITRNEYLEWTRNLTPVSTHSSGLIWTADYYKNGMLLRYSGLVDSDWVEVVDMLSEENVSRGDEK